MVHLVAGEDLRFTLQAAALETWAPAFLRRLDGTTPTATILADLPRERRSAAERLIQQLSSERLLVEATPEQTPEPLRGAARVHGDGVLAERVQLRVNAAPESEQAIHVFCEETLDESRALAFNAERLADGKPWLWVSTGALSRAYVGPLFLPWRGPCFGCLIAAFNRLTPAPEIRAALHTHVRRGGTLPRATLPAPALNIVAELVSWKLTASREVEVLPAVYRLHVIDLATFEVHSESVPVDVDCLAACSERAGPQ